MQRECAATAGLAGCRPAGTCTGASHTLIDPAILGQLNLSPTGVMAMHTALTSAGVRHPAGRVRPNR
jgi:hypothetical protein